MQPANTAMSSGEVRALHIGGFQVCPKWLYDRRGKKGR